MALAKKRSYDMVLGSFVSLGILVIVVLVFLIGRERRLFDARIPLHAHFPNVQGLAVGADVLLSGVVVGRVSSIQFPLMSESPQISRDVTVVMDISKNALPWIRKDSQAFIESKGLLGDKLVNIAIGSMAEPQVEAGAMLKSSAPVDLTKAMKEVQEILADTKSLLKGFVDEGGSQALAASAKSLQRLFLEIENGNGLIHQLIYDRGAALDAQASLRSVRDSAENLSDLMLQAKTGSGLLNALLYDESGARSIGHLEESLKNVAALSTDIRNGKGSLGLFLTDPGIYNEVFGLLNNLNRNRLLKSIIRYGLAKPAEN